MTRYNYLQYNMIFELYNKIFKGEGKYWVAPIANVIVGKKSVILPGVILKTSYLIYTCYLVN